MSEDNVLDMDNPEKYGIEDPEAPGEPNYWAQPVHDPISGTKKETRDQHEGSRAGQHDTSEGAGHTTGRGGRGGRGSHH